MIIILGSKGQLGTSLAIELAKRKYEFFAVDNEHLDVTHAKTLGNYISTLSPKVILNASAYTNVNLAEELPEVANKVNCQAVTNIWEQCVAKMNDCLPVILHYSTDYVFDGTQSDVSQYKETDLTNPLNQYGLSKYKGEKSLSLYEKHFIFRTSWLFSIHGANFVHTICKKLLENSTEAIKIVNDQFGSPTSAYSLSKMSVNIIDQIVNGDFQKNCEKLLSERRYGVYHFSGAGKFSWYEFGNIIRSYVRNYKENVRSITPSKSDYSKIARPHNSVLSCKKLTDWLSLHKDYFNWQKDCKYLVENIIKQQK